MNIQDLKTKILEVKEEIELILNDEAIADDEDLDNTLAEIDTARESIEKALEELKLCEQQKETIK